MLTKRSTQRTDGPLVSRNDDPRATLQHLQHKPNIFADLCGLVVWESRTRATEKGVLCLSCYDSPKVLPLSTKVGQRAGTCKYEHDGRFNMQGIYKMLQANIFIPLACHQLHCGPPALYVRRQTPNTCKIGPRPSSSCNPKGRSGCTGPCTNHLYNLLMCVQYYLI
jgi:hypothetical protein